MAYKFYNQESFTINLPGGDFISLHCSSQSTRYGFRHVCDFRRPGEYNYTRAKCCYYNRTWERFRYESVLRAAAEKCPPDIAAAIEKMIADRSRAEHEKAEAEFAAFKRDYDKCPAGVKKALSGVTVESEAEADFIAGTVKAIALLTGE